MKNVKKPQKISCLANMIAISLWKYLLRKFYFAQKARIYEIFMQPKIWNYTVKLEEKWRSHEKIGPILLDLN